MRFSKQREAVYSVLCQTDTHPDAVTIYHEAKKVLPTISLCTVYRNLDELCSLGKVRRIDLDDSTARYDANMQRHSHFVCYRCGRVLDVCAQEISSSCDVGSVERVEVTMYGICNDCL